MEVAGAGEWFAVLAVGNRGAAISNLRFGATLVGGAQRPITKTPEKRLLDIGLQHL
jgi:hypothetical protein